MIHILRKRGFKGGFLFSLLFKDNWGFYQVPHSKSNGPNPHCSLSVHHSSLIFPWTCRALWEPWDCWTHQQPVYSWNSLISRNLLQENGRCPFGWKCDDHLVLNSQPRLPTLSSKHCRLSRRTRRMANTPTHSHYRTASTNALPLDPIKQVSKTQQ